MTDLTKTTKEALKSLRSRSADRYGEKKLHEDGIFLSIRFRTENQMNGYARLVRQVGGFVLEQRKTGTARHHGDLTCILVFTLHQTRAAGDLMDWGVDGDRYLQGHINLRELSAEVA